MLTQSVPYEDVSSATVQAVRVASRVEVAGNDEPGVERSQLVEYAEISIHNNLYLMCVLLATFS